MVVMIGKETTIERLSDATNHPIWAKAQITPERNPGMMSGTLTKSVCFMMNCLWKP